MATEHAGGAIPEGLPKIPVEWAKDQARAIAVEPFPFEDLDTTEDHLLQALKEGRPIGHLLRELVRREMEAARQELVTQILTLIVDARKPGLRATQIAFAAGLYFTSGISGTVLARRHGISKEAFQQGVENVRRELGLRQTRNMRSTEARETMRRTNYRPTKPLS